MENKPLGMKNNEKTVNGIGNEGAKVLFEGLEENTTLTKLDLRGDEKEEEEMEQQRRVTDRQ